MAGRTGGTLSGRGIAVALLVVSSLGINVSRWRGELRVVEVRDGAHRAVEMVYLRKPEGQEYFGKDGGGSGPFINPLRRSTSWVLWDRESPCVWVWLGAGWWRRGGLWGGRGRKATGEGRERDELEGVNYRNCRGLHRTNEGILLLRLSVSVQVVGERNRNRTIKGKEWNPEACGSKERRTKADARSRLFPARSNPWGEFGTCGPRGGRMGNWEWKYKNTTRPHDWSCI
jgi:hypothetical protein